MKLWRALASRPTIWLTLDGVTQQAMWLLLFLILAPILGPKPYGLFAIVMAFVGFCELVIVKPTMESLVSVPEINDGHLRTANLFTVLAALGACVVTFSLAKPMAIIFGSPELKDLFRVLAPLPLISALTATPYAVLGRHMRFRALALRSITATFVAAVVAVCLAWRGAGIWALVAQAFTQRCVELAILWISAQTRLGFQWSPAHFRELHNYGSSIFISKCMFWAGSQIPRIILGWFLGPADLGLFALGGRMVDAISQVFIVPRSGIARLTLRRFADAPAGFANEFELTIRQIAILCFPVCCGVAAVMPTLFAAFLDSRWTPGILAAQIMVLTCIPATFYFCFTAAVLAVRQPRLDAQVAIATDSTTAFAVFVAAPHGLYIACAAMLAQRILMMPGPLLMLRRVAGISPIGVIWSQLPVLGAAATMGWIVTLSVPLVERIPSVRWQLAALILIGVVVYAPLALLAAPDIVRRICKRMFHPMTTNMEAV
jgi:O-antigen/teichoic acid export membrane protein